MRSLRRDLLIGVVIMVASQFYLNYSIEEFRFSSAAVLLPVLLIALRRARSAWLTGAVTAAMVVLFRLGLNLAAGQTLGEAFFHNWPAGIFYLCYGGLFALFTRSTGASLSWQGLSILCSDFFSNALELTLRLQGQSPTAGSYATLLGIALARTLLALTVLLLVKRYQLLLLREEHERRYQRLSWLIAGLKTEQRFMQKNTDEIETIMGHAYQLYEQLADLPEQRKLALAIARDVHEVKKDYLRIIRGVEQTLSEQEQQEEMSLRDLLLLLRGYCQQQIEERHLDLELELRCRHDFITDKQWALMSVLKNLVINAMEALEQLERHGHILVDASLRNGICLFLVEDNGPGISEKHLERIFDMGFSTKFDEVTGNIYRGVGLPGVKMTLEDVLGGTIAVQTRPGHYTRFRIEIPLGNLVKKDRPSQG